MAKICDMLIEKRLEAAHGERLPLLSYTLLEEAYRQDVLAP
jgi:hypothetical protein